ncbi:MAG TPA: dTDP-glucose 4,6-dehydratase [Clostridiales bacterium]|nr:dTDP-glucose 4,6-dehydratase [Clostridiales bacterium]
MNYLVTGGAGFIGSHFTDFLLSEIGRDDMILCLDNLTYAGNLKNLAEAERHENFRFVKGDICDKDFTDNVFSEFKPDVVINFAAQTHVDRSITSPEIFFSTNLMGTVNLLELSVKHKVSLFHQVSTDEVYGDYSERESLYPNGFTEDASLLPSSPYAASKASAEMAALSFMRTYSLNISISRPCNNFGERQYPEKLIPLTVKNALEGKPIPLYGDGGSVFREWVYVKDTCRAIYGIIQKRKNGCIYNISPSFSIDNKSLVEKILKIMNKPESLIAKADDRKGHDIKYRINSNKLLSELGFEFIYDFDESLERTVKSLIENESRG